MEETSSDAVGGYFGVELSTINQSALPDNIQAFQSSRASFLALLQASGSRIRRIHVPYYICDSMLQPLQQVGIPIERYELTSKFAPTITSVADADLVLLVNYFGLCDVPVREAGEALGWQNVLVDNSQALFAHPYGVASAFYSPRKFLGVSDGGWVRFPEDRPPLRHFSEADHRASDVRSLGRAQHLLERWAIGAERGFASFRKSEESLDNQEPEPMSRLSREILRHTNLTSVSESRRANFTQAHRSLAPFNEQSSLCDSLSSQTPLCYPFMSDSVPKLRQKLMSTRVFCPTYWPELLQTSRVVPDMDRARAELILPIPIDQRISPEQLDQRVLRPILQVVSS